jgi:type I restriction enzyme, S subunit
MKPISCGSERISDTDRHRLRGYSLALDDIVFSRVGSVDRNALIRETEAGWLFSGRLLRVRPRKQWAYAPYLSYQFHGEPFKQRVRDVAVGQTMASLNTTILKNVKVVLPTLPEQHAIAEALGEVDALIGGLERLIAKKRDLKQAAMQQLLTGQTRLPGFSGEWEVTRFGQLFQFLGTANNPRADLSAIGDVAYIHYGDIHTTNSAFLYCSQADMPMISRELIRGVSFVEEGDLVMVDASEDYVGIGKAVEVCHVQGREIVAGLHTFLLRGNNKSLANGFKGYLQFIPSVKAALIRFATGYIRLRNLQEQRAEHRNPASRIARAGGHRYSALGHGCRDRGAGEAAC